MWLPPDQFPTLAFSYRFEELTTTPQPGDEANGKFVATNDEDEGTFESFFAEGQRGDSSDILIYDGEDEIADTQIYDSSE